MQMDAQQPAPRPGSKEAQSEPSRSPSTSGAIPSGVARTGTSQASASSTASSNPSSDVTSTAFEALIQSGTSPGGTARSESSSAWERPASSSAGRGASPALPGPRERGCRPVGIEAGRDRAVARSSAAKPPCPRRTATATVRRLPAPAQRLARARMTPLRAGRSAVSATARASGQPDVAGRCHGRSRRVAGLPSRGRTSRSAHSARGRRRTFRAVRSRGASRPRGGTRVRRAGRRTSISMPSSRRSASTWVCTNTPYSGSEGQEVVTTWTRTRCP